MLRRIIPPQGRRLPEVAVSRIAGAAHGFLTGRADVRQEADDERTFAMDPLRRRVRRVVADFSAFEPSARLAR